MFEQLVILKRGKRLLYMLIERMSDFTAEGGVISREVKRIFQRAREIVCEDKE